jgi:DUF177 domain-containing protein
MHIEVGDILRREVGHATEAGFEAEQPELADIPLTGRIRGRAELVSTEDGIVAQGEATLPLELECHRCLRAFDWQPTIAFGGEFVHRPEVEQWPIGPGRRIDLDPLISQEMLLALPIKHLCRPDCPGLCPECGRPQDEGTHTHQKGTK